MNMEETMGHTVEWGRWIGEGWQMFVDDWKGWVIKMLAVVLIILIPLIPIYAVIFAAQVVAEGSENQSCLRLLSFSCHFSFYSSFWPQRLSMPGHSGRRSVSFEASIRP